MADFRKTPLEMFVRAFVRQNRKFPDRVGQLQLAKAIALINNFRVEGCCNEDDLLALGTPKDTLITNTVRMLLKTMTRAGNTQSLQRAEDLLTTFKEGACCD